MKTSPPTKRLTIVHGDKGGVGKSTFARVLADYYTSHSLNWRGYDTDATNGHLLRFYPEHTRPIDIHEPASLDQLVVRTGLSPGQASVALAHLEVGGWVVGEAGWWEQVRKEAPAK